MRAVLALALTCAACGGILDEDEGSSNPLLDQVTPPTCAEPTAGGDGHHRAGEDCLGCHRQGGDGTPFSVAGTLYADTGGTAPAAGVAIHVLDAAGADVAMITATNGNFWSTDPLVAPAVAYQRKVSEGMQPYAVCTTSEEFAAYTKTQLGIALKVRPVDGLALIGWDYESVFSRRTVSAGVLAGTNQPSHSCTTMSLKPCSASVGTSGRNIER